MVLNLMKKYVSKQKCEPHQEETIDFVLDPLIQNIERYLCKRCLIRQSSYRYIKIKEDDQKKFKEMIISDFNHKKNQITNEKLQNIQNQIREFLRLFNKWIRDSIKILYSKIQEAESILNAFVQSKTEMENEQDLLNLSNFLNNRFNSNLNQLNKKNMNSLIEFNNNQIIKQSIIRKSKFYSSYKTQIQLNRLVINLFQNQLSKKYSVIQNKVKINQKQYKMLINKWQIHLQNVKTSINNFQNLGQNNHHQTQFQGFISYKFCNQVKNQTFSWITKINSQLNNNLIKQRNELESSILNKQIYQMDLKEVQYVANKLSFNSRSFVKIRLKKKRINLKITNYYN